MFAIEGTNFFRRILFEHLLRGNALAGGGPHVSNVKILKAVIVVIEPGNAHPRANVLNSCPRSNIGEGAIAVVAVEIFATEIVHHVQVGPTVAVVVAPPAAETVAGIVLAEIGFGCNVAKGSIAIVSHHEIGRTIFGVVIRNGILVLVGPLVIDVQTKIDVQESVAIVVGNGRTGESSLRTAGELERIRLAAKLAIAFIHVQKRAAGANNDYVLTPAIAEVGKESARC